MSSELRPPEPWHSFLLDLNDALQSPARLDCIGGSLSRGYTDSPRPTADVDVIELAPREASETNLGGFSFENPVSPACFVTQVRSTLKGRPDFELPVITVTL
jgi:hypothetical protein